MAALRDPRPLDAYATPGWITDPPEPIRRAGAARRAPPEQVRALRGVGRHPDAKPAAVPPAGGRERAQPGRRRRRGDRDRRRLRLAGGAGGAALHGSASPRGGASTARRRGPRPQPGLARAGEWVAFLDDDDLLAPTRLRAHLDGVGAAGFGFCGQLLVDPERRTVGTLPAVSASGLFDRLRTKSSIGGPSAVVARTELVRQVGGFGEEFYALADWDLWMRLASTATATATPELLVAYTLHSSNMHLDAPDRVLADFDRFQRAHDVTPAAEIELLEWLAVDLERAGRGRGRGPAPSAPRPPAPPPAERRPSGARRSAAEPEPAEPGEPHLAGPEWLRQYRVRDA